jgi:fatty-acyl-CoA synthase
LANDDLVEFCRGKLASFKIPRYTLVLDEFPMTPSGKAQKFKLRKMVLQAITSGEL